FMNHELINIYMDGPCGLSKVASLVPESLKLHG
nr:hypothetical protein [Tanacetum cinerariifolium]